MEASSIAQASVAAQDSFQKRFDLDDPVAAMASYAQQMRQFTQRQMESVTRSRCRTSPNSASAAAPLSPESSIDRAHSLESVSSQS